MTRTPDANNEDTDVLDCLHGVKCAQQRLRRGGNPERLVREAVDYLKELPEEVTRRLTEIDVSTLLSIDTDMPRLAAQLASDAAFAQVIRAANVYRGELGYAPLGADGQPVKTCDM